MMEIRLVPVNIGFGDLRRWPQFVRSSGSSTAEICDESMIAGIVTTDNSRVRISPTSNTMIMVASVIVEISQPLRLALACRWLLQSMHIVDGC
jgi:hypothetical protein